MDRFLRTTMLGKVFSAALEPIRDKMRSNPKGCDRSSLPLTSTEIDSYPYIFYRSGERIDFFTSTQPSGISGDVIYDVEKKVRSLSRRMSMDIAGIGAFKGALEFCRLLDKQLGCYKFFKDEDADSCSFDWTTFRTDCSAVLRFECK